MRNEALTKAELDARLREASRLDECMEYRAAARIFKELAEAGDPSGMLNLGVAFSDGRGVRRSQTLALHWFRKALRRGCSSAANNIGCVYRDLGRHRLAERWFERAIREGDDDAALTLAKMCLDVWDDRARAKRLLKRVLRSRQVTEDSQEQAAEMLRQLELRR